MILRVCDPQARRLPLNALTPSAERRKSQQPLKCHRRREKDSLCSVLHLRARDPSPPRLLESLLQVVNPPTSVEQWTLLPRQEQLLAQVAQLAHASSSRSRSQRPDWSSCARQVDGVGESPGKDESTLLVLCRRVDDHLRAEPGRDGDTGGDARAHLVTVSRVGEDRCARPKDVGCGRVGVALRRRRMSDIQNLGRIEPRTSVVSRNKSAMRPRWM